MSVLSRSIQHRTATRPFVRESTAGTDSGLISQVATEKRLINEKATRQLGGLFFQGRIVLTEGKFRQNFLAKSYEPKKQGVKEIFHNERLYYQLLMK